MILIATNPPRHTNNGATPNRRINARHDNNTARRRIVLPA
jgi:hypothetical protein